MIERTWIRPVGFVIAAVLIGAGFKFVWSDAAAGTEASLREQRIAQLRAQVQPNEAQHLIWAPWLTAESYDIGAVSPLDGFGQAVTSACNVVAVDDVPLSLTIGDSEEFAISANLGLAEQLGVNATGKRVVSHRMTIDAAVMAPARNEMLQQLYEDPDCVAALASRPVLILYGRYRGDETYAFKRGGSGGFSFSGVLDAVGLGAGADGEGALDENVSREQSTLIWALTEIELEEPDIGAIDAPLGDAEAEVMAMRETVAEALVLEESDYWRRAIPRTRVSAPSDEALRKLDDVIRKAEAAARVR